MALMRIGRLARQSGFTAKTLRYYEEVGLLQPAGRSSSGYRLYSDDAVRRMRFVSRAKALGLQLADIRTILEITDEGRAPCDHVVAIVDRELDLIEGQMLRLGDLRRDLLALKSRMDQAIASGAMALGGGCPCFQDEAG